MADVVGAITGVIDTTAAIGAAIGEIVPTHRQCTIEISNECAKFSLCNPRMHIVSGSCAIPLLPLIGPSRSDTALFIKTPNTARGSVGVFTYDLQKTDADQPKKKIAVMFCVPYDFTRYSNLYAVGIFDKSRDCNYDLYYKMYNNTDKSFVRGLCFLPACFPHDYILVERALTWFEAQRYCRSAYRDLATVVNEQELSKLVDTARKYLNGHVWIGLTDKVHTWKWSFQKEGYYGGGEAEFRMWRGNEPNNLGGYENCAEILHDGSWNDLPCGLKIPFVCYNVQMNLRLVRMKLTASDSSVNMENASKDIMQQFNQALKDKGLDKNVKLTWKKQPDGKIFHMEEKEKERERK
ncbi:DELTA-stichotoxin-Hmg2b-like [Scomber scombrus]|uniref:DELTA-stichotoxin-Hmg2b-like n=1 Tax=Scomber scombrus TaxID=13677 RepID=A0AAV1Q571_SCOSC